MKAVHRFSQWLSVSLALVSLGITSVAAFAQQDHDSGQSSYKYTLASICGDYAVVATYGANTARALGTASFDGQGKLTGSAIVNQPGPNSTRTVVSIGLAGNYSVNADGTGVMFLTIALPNGNTASVSEDLVISKTKFKDGFADATEIVDAQRQPSAVIDDSGFVTHTYTLRATPESCRRDH